MTLQDILNHPADQEMVFEGEDMREVLYALTSIDLPYRNDTPETLASIREVDARARRIRMSATSYGDPSTHGIRFAYMVGRHWTYEPKDCKHEQFRIGADIGSILKDGQDSTNPNEEPAYYSASIKVSCSHCGDPFEFVGLPFGFSPYRPTVSIDSQTLSVSVMPVGKTIPEGLAGFNVTAKVFEEKEAVKQ